MAGLIINCDLGENEPLEKTRALMRLIDAANICCGVHAGSPEKTEETIGIALELGVLIGAHPGMGEAGGRGYDLPGRDDFRRLLENQVGDFRDLLSSRGAKLHHVKLHGSLYHAVEYDEALADEYVDFLRSIGGVAAVSLAGGSFAGRARSAGIRVFEEVFADRAYEPTGALVARTEPGAVIKSAVDAAKRFRSWRASGKMPAVDGSEVSLSGQTICVHSDSAIAEDLLIAIRG